MTSEKASKSTLVDSKDPCFSECALCRGETLGRLYVGHKGFLPCTPSGSRGPLTGPALFSGSLASGSPSAVQNAAR